MTPRPPNPAFSRQLLLPEIGSEGQTRIEGTPVRVVGPSALATEVAELYLARAGAPLDQNAPYVSEVGDMTELHRDASLAVCAAWLSGTFAAVEHIKAVVGAGRPGQINLSLDAER